MWCLLLPLLLLAVRLYNKLSCGWFHSTKIITGKVAVVTGANAGIGYWTALNFARRGARVYLACRDEARGRAAEAAIRAKTGSKQVHFRRLDLASLASVRAFVDDFKRSEVKLDILVNNAGAIGYGQRVTEDGLLEELQTNHFGPFLLSVLLAPLLRRTDGARVVFVSSVAHWFGAADPATLNRPPARRSYLGVWRLYSSSKLCNVLVSNELARRLAAHGVTVNSLHPGHVRTSLYKNVDSVAERFMNLVLSTFFKSSEEGSQTSVFLALSDDVADVTGRYFVDCKESPMSRAAQDQNLAQELWSYSEKMVKLAPEERI